jgi:hypothetical protein
MFVAEINGQGIVAFGQPSPDDAPGWTDDEEFRSGLISLKDRMAGAARVIPAQHGNVTGAPKIARIIPRTMSAADPAKNVLLALRPSHFTGR